MQKVRQCKPTKGRKLTLFIRKGDAVTHLRNVMEMERYMAKIVNYFRRKFLYKYLKGF